ncbi:MAG: UDP-N-acetylglucosamine 1-carboxyvinyltransferase [Bacilli bacterium]|nr:UDP-N-acetylglucosamine 1-carboxyvinyltransferase [Bacilli bacterium]
MERILIEGGKPLEGEVRVHGAKNAALPILAASVMAAGESTIQDVPNLQDIDVMKQILTALGAKFSQSGSTVTADASAIITTDIPDELMRKMRSSIFLMGPLLARFGSVRVSKPGGCSIGTRGIDLHVKGLQQLGAEIKESHGYITCSSKKLQGTSIYLDLPSVGATENLMMAASLAEGTTVIGNAAREPEIADLARYLNRMGAKISGAGEDTIYVEGVAQLHATEHQIIPDRIVAGTLLIATAITHGCVTVTNVNPDHLGVVLTKLRETGVEFRMDHDIQLNNNRIEVRALNRLQALDRIQTTYYPGFPTDLQAPIMALLSVAKGTSVISEGVFEERMHHVSELRRMGAKIKLDHRTAFVEGVEELSGAVVEATDLRAGAALVIAGLAATGTTCVDNIHHIDRGYEQIENLLASLGASVKRIWM